jgi:hypothetical protein
MKISGRAVGAHLGRVAAAHHNAHTARHKSASELLAEQAADRVAAEQKAQATEDADSPDPQAATGGDSLPPLSAPDGQ